MRSDKKKAKGKTVTTSKASNDKSLLTSKSKKSRRKKQKNNESPNISVRKDDIIEPPKDETELRLESLVFSERVHTDDSDASIHSEGEKEKEVLSAETQPEIEAETTDQPSFFIDTTPMDHIDVPKNDVSTESSTLVQGKPPKKTWTDSDDEILTVSLNSKARFRKLKIAEDEDVITGDQYEKRLRQQFERIYPKPEWATLPSEARKRKTRDESSDSSSDDFDIGETRHLDTRIDKEISREIRETFNHLRKEKSKLLNQGRIEVTKMKDANQMGYSQSVVQSLCFHPDARVLMVAGLDKTLRLFQIDGKSNPKIQSIFFSDLPIRQARFNSAGSQILLTGRRKYYYVYDVESGHMSKTLGILGRPEKSFEKFAISPNDDFIVFQGQDGCLIIVDYKTKRWITNLKMNAGVRDMNWSSDGRYIYSLGNNAEVCQWDIGMRKCVHKWVDDGGFKPTNIAVANADEYFAIG
ncbi:10057_t:CDS:2 [Paraglomus occultum]|uniref:10057_t:CDS:1 n=1 Tax=Paraglomus occultum TaxID=144539 RepID=A0A9N8WKZ8_9GLOM|nr:10057_t:CDS:2 [Paraglomus occultum]